MLNAGQHKLPEDDASALIDYLILSGFSAIWVDRYGYDDSGDGIIRELTEAGAKLVLADKGDRYVLLDLEGSKRALMDPLTEESFRLLSELTTNPIVLNWGKGFYKQETNSNGVVFRWSQARSHLALSNSSNLSRKGSLLFDLQSGSIGIVRVRIGDQIESVAASSQGTQVNLPVSFDSGETVDIEFIAEVEQLNANNDKRNLFFNVQGLSFKEDYAVPRASNGD